MQTSVLQNHNLVNILLVRGIGNVSWNLHPKQIYVNFPPEADSSPQSNEPLSLL